MSESLSGLLTDEGGDEVPDDTIVGPCTVSLVVSIPEGTARNPVHAVELAQLAILRQGMADMLFDVSEDDEDGREWVVRGPDSMLRDDFLEQFEQQREAQVERSEEVQE